MKKYDLTPIAPYLDRHLVFPLQKFLLERQPNARDEILKDMIELLSKTYMVDTAMDIYKSLYHTEDVPQEMIDRRVYVVTRLKSLKKSAAPVLSFLHNPDLIQELRFDKQYNLQMLNDRYQIGPDQIKALYQYAEFQFKCGNYSGAADLSYQYLCLCPDNDSSFFSALLGKLEAEILMQNWEIALQELNRVKEIIDSENFPSQLDPLQTRTSLMHWSLFIFFNHKNGRKGIIDLFLQDRYLDAIQSEGRHLLCYVATAVIVKRRRNMLEKLIKVIQQYPYKDPITEFLKCLYINRDFEGAQQKLRECEDVILNDPFLGKQVQEAVPLRDEFLENARLFIFETYCSIHQFIDIGTLGEELNMSDDEVGRCVNHVRKLDPKIDSKLGIVIKTPNYSKLFEQIIKDSEQSWKRRICMLLDKNMIEWAPAA